MPIFPLEQLIPFAGVVCVGIFVQSVTGFASGLIIVPLMLWAGHALPEAQAALLVATTPQNLLGVYRFRNDVDWPQLRLPIVLRFTSLPIGVAVLYFVDGFPVDLTRQLVGAVIIGSVLLLALLRPQPQDRLHAGWAWLAFLTSGFFAGLTGTGGPMMVVWVQAHRWSTERSRSFLFAMYLASLPPIFGLLYLTFGDRILRAALSAMLFIPLLLLVTQLGLKFGSLLGRERLRALTLVLLLLLGAIGLFSPFI